MEGFKKSDPPSADVNGLSIWLGFPHIRNHRGKTNISFNLGIPPKNSPKFMGKTMKTGWPPGDAKLFLRQPKIPG